MTAALKLAPHEEAANQTACDMVVLRGRFYPREEMDRAAAG